MPNFDRPKKPVRGDWPSHYIVYKLRERKTSLRRVASTNGYAPSAGSTAIYVPWPKMERLIAGAIGVEPRDIWPSRYNKDGTPKSKRGARGLGRYRPKNSTRPGAVTVEKGRAV